MNFVYYRVKTNKEKFTEILPNLLLTPPYKCASAMPKAKQAKDERRREWFVGLSSYYFMVHPNSSLPVHMCEHSL